MSFGFSIGDIVLCGQITCRLYTAATSGRQNAPRDLRELEDVLLGLTYSLNNVQRVSQRILCRGSSPLDYDADVGQQLGFMIRSCLHTLQLLENATDKYRATAIPSLAWQDEHRVNFVSSQKWTTQVKLQWRRIMWDFRGESLTQYRRKLESHTSAINLLLSTLIWSTADRIEQNGLHQCRQMEELVLQGRRTSSAVFHHASRFANTLFHPTQSLDRPTHRYSWDPSRDTSPSMSSTPRTRLRLDRDLDRGIYLVGSRQGHASLSS